MTPALSDEIKRLLYTTKDGRWYWETDYANDQLELDDDDIDFSRIPQIRALLTPGATGRDLAVPFEAALVLAAWGDEAGLEYLKYIVDLDDEDRVGCGYSHRLRKYDTTLEWVVAAATAFAAFRADYEQFDQRARSISPMLLKILKLSETHQFEFHFLPWILRRQFREYDAGLRSYLQAMLRDDGFHHHKPAEAVKFFAEYDPEYLDQTLLEFGKTRADYITP